MSLKEKILIADDSEMNQMLLEEILSDKYEYVMAKDGTEAVDILEKNDDIDLVMLDINMPKMDGFGVLEVMNLRHWISEVPVIIISSENDVDFIRRSYDLGASDYISRPFDLTVVRRRVENTLMLYARQKRLVRLVEEQVYEREKTNNTMINILSHVIEYRNNESGQHILHVRMMTGTLLHRLIEITDKYPLTETDISMIVSISALHDIGKISVPKAILNKPGKLDPEEWEIMKNHAAIGDAMLYDLGTQQAETLMNLAHEICRCTARSRCSRPPSRSAAGITSAGTAAATRTASRAMRFRFPRRSSPWQTCTTRLQANAAIKRRSTTRPLLK